MATEPTYPSHRPARYQMSFKMGEIVNALGGVGPARRWWLETLVPQLQTIFPQGDYVSEVGSICYDEIDQTQYDLLFMLFGGMIFGVLDWSETNHGSWAYLDTKPMGAWFPDDLRVTG